MNELLKLYLKSEIEILYRRLEIEKKREGSGYFLEGYKKGQIEEINRQICNLQFILKTDWNILTTQKSS
ncbi:hypothetical protein [Maledivibacter halophilus]|uniref:Uncharacterized protein n=1 Tax=Maledivibacter halophilus TaxID=36842 RepID=A0A1T5LCN5_9FIRM|nr:hypothetical protein [Maledivibacter halophilus]SKC73752.1 hypothetical protein SAMN02194393_02766 [Maledivibacter halophilus]